MNYKYVNDNYEVLRSTLKQGAFWKERPGYIAPSYVDERYYASEFDKVDNINNVIAVDKYSTSYADVKEGEYGTALVVGDNNTRKIYYGTLSKTISTFKTDTYITVNTIVPITVKYKKVNGRCEVLRSTVPGGTFFRAGQNTSFYFCMNTYGAFSTGKKCTTQMVMTSVQKTDNIGNFFIVDRYSIPNYLASANGTNNGATTGSLMNNQPTLNPVIEEKVHVDIEAEDIEAEDIEAEDVKSNSNNIFYSILNHMFNDPDRNARSINNKIISLMLGNNKLNPNLYNCSGNLNIHCTIPGSESNYPNYTNIILNSTTVVDQNTSLISILTSFITNPDFITTYFYDEKLMATHNGVPLIDISKHLNTPNMCWNWNSGRKYTLETVKSIANYYMLKLNELIDHIITNDLRIVDNDFNDKLLSLFANTDGVIYSHSNSTLVLPSLVNYLVSKNGGKHHALNMCGYIKKGSKIFPVPKGTEWKNVKKWNGDKNITTGLYIDAPCNVNGLIVSSKYNYPLLSTNQQALTLETPKTTLDNITGVNIQFKEDNYDYDKHVEVAKAMVYATQDIGTKKAGANESFEITNDVILIPDLRVKYKDVLAKKSVVVQNSRIVSKDESRTSKGDGAKLVWCNSKPEHRYQLSSNTYNYYQGCSDSFIDVLTRELKKPKTIIDNSNNEVVSIIKPAEQDIVITDFEIVTFDDISGDKWAEQTEILHSEAIYAIETEKLDPGTGCGWVYNEKLVSKQTVREYLGVKMFSGSQMFSIKNVMVRVSYKLNMDNTMQYTGSVGIDRAYTLNDQTPIYGGKAICLYTTNVDLYLFNTNVFNYWMTIIKNSNNQQLILNEMRRYIKEHPELILVNKINKVIGDYARSFESSVSFIGNPIGPPLITIPNSFVVPHKNYFPTFKFINDVDLEKTVYDKSKECVDIINSVSYEESNNYLDVLFSSIVSESRLVNTALDNGSVLSILIPAKGFQLFEVINKSFTSLIPNKYVVSVSRYDDKTSIIYNYEVPKILISFKDFDTDMQTKLLLTSYKKLMSVNVPVMKFIRNGENIDVDINTSSINNENVVHIYVSSDSTQEIISNVKGSGGADEKDKNVDKNNVTNAMINIQYNGIDSDRTPMCLQSRL